YNAIGAALLSKDDLDGAISSIRKGLRLAPEHSLLHYNLGVAMRKKGKFALALASFEKARDLEARKPTWHPPVKQAVKETGRLLELERLVPAVLAGKYRPKDATEEFYLGLACKYTKRYAAAARFFATALTAKPELAGAWGRYDTACFAILAA